MDFFEKHIQETIDSQSLLRKEANSPVIVALSGGADSVALLSALNSLGYNCIAAHCNFHLRPTECIRDMRHSEKIARKLGVNIYIKDFNVAERVALTGESIEMACRHLRYKWFHELLDRDYSQAIAVGHHREDNIETFFINLLRTTGLAGLKGMQYRRGYVVRPMLDLSRQDIESYLERKGLNYVTDSTNAQNDYRRNRLRNIILPALETQFPGASNAILSTMRHLADAHALLSRTINYTISPHLNENGDINVTALIEKEGEETAHTVLFEYLKEHGFNATHTDNIIKAVRNQRTGLRFEADGKRFAELDRGILSLHTSLVSGIMETVSVSLSHDILSPLHIQVTPHSVLEFVAERNPNVIYLDSKVLEGNATFEIRQPRKGDKIHPYGMKGSKLVSDILKDAKFSSAQKRDVRVLTRNGVILWIIGLRASAHFNLTPKTQSYLRLELKQHSRM